MKKPEPTSTGISADPRFYGDDRPASIGPYDHQRGTPDLAGDEQPQNELPTRPDPSPFKIGGQ